MLVQYIHPYLNLSDRIIHLENLGLTIPNKAVAEKVISEIGFSRFKIYSAAFMSKNEQFRPRTNFYHVRAVYELDIRLRKHLMTALEIIEIYLRSAWVDAITFRYGPLVHTDPTKFQYQAKWQKNKDKLDEEWQKTTDKLLAIYRAKYIEPPIWFAVHAMSFGTLSKWIAISPADVLKDLMQRFQVQGLQSFVSAVQALTILRNHCAHYSRIWNNQFPVAFPSYSSMVGPSISSKKVASAINLIAHFLTQVDSRKAQSWISDMNEMIKNLPPWQRKLMGFA